MTLQATEILPRLAACLSAQRRPSGAVFALQIGAMDGVQFDPLYQLIPRHHWHALLVEPLPQSFSALQKHYEGVPGIRFANCAIGEAKGRLPLYHVPPDIVEHHGLPAWVLGISSLSREHVEAQEAFFNRFGHTGLMDYVEEVSVDVVPLQTLLEQHRCPEVDILQIDAEGHDYRILRQWDFSHSQPSVINFEHARLSPAEKQSAIELLLSQSYALIRHGLDMLAFRPELIMSCESGVESSQASDAPVSGYGNDLKPL